MPLSASFVADFSSFIGQTQEAVAAMQGFKQSAEELGPGVDRGLDDTLKKYEQVGRQTRQLAQDTFAAAQTFIGAYTEEQDAVQRLTSALQAQGQATPAVTDAYSKLATQFQATTKYADEAVIGVQATLTTIGKVGPEQMELALTAVTNLASGMKIDLTTAANMVAKAVGSGGESLGKLKVVLGDAYREGMTTAEMLQALNDKMGPAAQNELQTYNGQMANLQNQMSDFNESVGKVLVETLTQVLGAFRSLPEGVQSFVLIVGTIGTVLAPVLVSLSSLVSLLMTTGLGAGMVSAFTSILTFIGPAGWITLAVIAIAALIYKNWDAIAGATQRLYEAIKTWLVDRFNGLVAGITATIEKVAGAFTWLYNTVVGHSIVPDMINGIGSEFGRLDQEMVQPVAEATAQVQAHLKLMAAQMRANSILNRNSLFTTGGQLEEVARVFDAASGGGGGGGGAPTTINNTFNIVDTESNIVRRVSDLIMGQIRSGTQLGTA
jgi:hypothetical protein